MEESVYVTRADIVEAMRRLGVQEGDRLFAHSSLSAFGCVEGGAEALCDALLDAVGKEGTVAMPTFTWSMNHRTEIVTFDVAKDRCEVGAVPEAFRQRPEAIRDEHVCHSIAAIGRRAAEVVGDGVRSFAWGSGMYRLYEMDFWYVFLGCGFGACTALHTVEEVMQVPYRYYRHYHGSTVIRPNRERVPARSIEFLRYQPYANDFEKMGAICAQHGLVRDIRVGKARIMLLKMRELVDLGVKLMKEDITFLLSEASRKYFRDSVETGFSPSAKEGEV